MVKQIAIVSLSSFHFQKKVCSNLPKVDIFSLRQLMASECRLSNRLMWCNCLPQLFSPQLGHLRCLNSSGTLLSLQIKDQSSMRHFYILSVLFSKFRLHFFGELDLWGSRIWGFEFNPVFKISFRPNGFSSYSFCPDWAFFWEFNFYSLLFQYVKFSCYFFWLIVSLYFKLDSFWTENFIV